MHKTVGCTQLSSLCAGRRPRIFPDRRSPALQGAVCAESFGDSLETFGRRSCGVRRPAHSERNMSGRTQKTFATNFEKC